MDNLKPLLEHKFWILLGLTLILAITGWWMATGQLAAETSQRVETLDSVFQKVPTKKKLPNDKWIDRLKKLNTQKKQRLRQTRYALWQEQQKLMTWPAVIEDTMDGIPYRGPVPDSARDLYRNAYFDELYKLRQIVDPVEEANPEGKLVLPEDAIVDQVPEERWQNVIPEIQEMWDAQEDIWLLTDLFKSIKAVNAGANSITEAPVKKLVQIDLVGGSVDAEGNPITSKSTEGEGQGPGGGSPTNMGGENPTSPGFNFGSGFSSSGGDRFQQQDQAGRPVDFDPVAEFGIAEKQQPEEGTSGPPGASDSGSTEAGFNQYSSSDGQQAEEKRYVHEGENFPFKTRGFYLKVVMRHDSVPELLVQLTNSDWPVKIVRVHQRDLYLDPVGEDSQGRFASSGSNRVSGLSRFNSDDYPMSSGEGGETDPSQTLQHKIASAMADPYLAEVVVAGLMTLYEAPENSQQSPGTAGGGTPVAGNGQRAPAGQAGAAGTPQNAAGAGSPQTPPASSSPDRSNGSPNQAQASPPNPTTSQAGNSQQPGSSDGKDDNQETSGGESTAKSAAADSTQKQDSGQPAGNADSPDQ